MLQQIYSIFCAKGQQVVPATTNEKKRKTSWRVMLQQTYSIFSASEQQVVPMTIIYKKKNQLVSYAAADLFNIFSKRATGCPDDYYIKKRRTS